MNVCLYLFLLKLGLLPVTESFLCNSYTTNENSFNNIMKKKYNKKYIKKEVTTRTIAMHKKISK